MQEKISGWEQYYQDYYYYRISDGVVLGYVCGSKFPYASFWGVEEDSRKILGYYIDFGNAKKVIEAFHNSEVIKENNYQSFMKYRKEYINKKIESGEASDWIIGSLMLDEQHRSKKT